MDPLDAIPKVGHILFIKQELIEADSPSPFDRESTDFVTQPVKNEDEALPWDEVSPFGQRPTTSFRPPVNFFTRIKTETDTESFNSVNPPHSRTEIKDEAPERWLKYENVCENNGREDHFDVDVRKPEDHPSYFGTVGGKNNNQILLQLNREVGEADLVKDDSSSEQVQTKSSSSVISFVTEMEGKVNEEDDMLVDPLHTCFEISDQEDTSEADIRKSTNISPIDEIGDIGDLDLDHLKTKIRRKLRKDENVNPRESTKENAGQNSTFRKKIDRRQKRFTCNHCSASFSRGELLKEHIYTHTGEKPFSCNQCSASYACKSNLNKHMQKHTGEKPFSCCHCSASFTRKSSLITHMCRHTGERPFICSHCSASFAHKSNLNVHLRRHADGKLFISRKRGQLNEDVKTHTGEKPFSCSHCSGTFARKSSLKEHLLKHSDEKPFRCSHCSASYANKRNFKRHMQGHTGEKPFICTHCSASFILKGNLNEHIRTHTGERPFKCSHCTAAFAVKSNLKRHMLKHIKEKQFICRHCSARFAEESYLKRHLMKHKGEGPFICSHCSISYAFKSNLNRHMRKHTGEKLFSRNYCSASFTNNCKLKSCIRMHTGAEGETARPSGMIIKRVQIEKLRNKVRKEIDGFKKS